MNIEQLKAGGIDYDAGLHRFADNQRIYEKYLRKLLDLTLLAEAQTALEQGDMEAAFERFHKLKAFVGNLSIPVLYEKIRLLTESLRQQTIDPDTALHDLAVIEARYEQICQVIREES